MKRLFLVLTPFALVLLAASCSDSDSPPSNGVPSPAGGGAGMPNGGATASGGVGGGTGGTAGGASLGGGIGAAGDSSEGGASGGTAGSSGSTGNAGAAGDDGTAGEAGATSIGFDGSCATLPGTVVYIESGDTQENLLKSLGRKLRDNANITLAFNLTGSCTLTNDIYVGANVVKSSTLKYIPSSAENSSWTTSMAESTCTTGADGVPVDLAISALFVQSCGLGDPPTGSNLDLIQGPIQAYTFVVPSLSGQNAIWSQEAYYAFGFGDANPLAPTYNPWNNESFLFIRPVTKSTLVATAKNIGVPPAKWKGVAEAASSDVVSAVATASNTDAALGILGAEVYDGARSTNGIRTLAFQAVGQNGAFYPDSSSTSFDKQNVRDGHYTLWSPTVYITPVDSSHVPTNPAVKYLEDLVLGNADAAPPGGGPAFDALADVVNVGLIPECAMKVTRSEDGGDLSPYVPAEPCTCYYLSQSPESGGVPAGCTVCTSADDCGGGVCSHGFCEPDAVSTTGSTVTGCVTGTPVTHADLINACTDAQALQKTVVLPADDPSPLP